MAAVRHLAQDYPRSSTWLQSKAYMQLTTRKVFEILTHKATKQPVFSTSCLMPLHRGTRQNLWMKHTPQKLEG